MGVTFLSKMVSKRVRSGTSERAASLINTLLSNPGRTPLPFSLPSPYPFQRLLGRLSILHGQDNNDQIKASAVEKKPLDKLSPLLSTMPIRIKSV